MRSKSLMAACILAAVLSMGAEVGRERFKGFRLPYYDDDGRLAWVLESEEIRRIGESEVEMLAPKVSVYGGEKGEEWISSTLTAARGMTGLAAEQVLPSSPNASLSGGVRISVFDQDGNARGSLVSDAMAWDGETETASGNGEATIEFEQNLVKGTGFRFEIERGVFSLEREISGVLAGFDLPAALSEERIPIEVECGGPGLFSLQERKVELRDDVEAKTGEGVLGAELLTLTVGEGRTLTSLEAEGGVEVKAARYEGSADRLSWSEKTEVLRFEGNPLRLASGEWSYVAERGEYDASGDRFVASGVRKVERAGEDELSVEFEGPGELEATGDEVVLRGRPVLTGLLDDGTLAADALVVRRGGGNDVQTLEASGDALLKQGEVSLGASWLSYAVGEHRIDAHDDVQVTHPDVVVSAASLSLMLTESNDGILSGEADDVEVESAEFSARAGQATWVPGESSKEGVPILASSAFGSGMLTLAGKPRVKVVDAEIIGGEGDYGELVLTAEEKVVVDFEKGMIEPVGSPEIRSGDVLIRSERLRAILDRQMGGEGEQMVVREVEGDGGVHVTKERIRAEAESVRAYGAGRRSIQLERDITIHYPVEEEEYEGEAVVTAAGVARWDMEAGTVEMVKDVVLMMPPYRARGERAWAKLSAEGNDVEVISLYGKPAVIEGTDFAVPSEEITALVAERRVKIRKGYQGTWHVREKGDENQSSEEAAEGR